MCLLPVESYNRLKPSATVSYKWLKKSHLDMLDTCYHVKPCTFQIVSWNGLNIRFLTVYSKTVLKHVLFYLSFVRCYETREFLNDLTQKHVHRWVLCKVVGIALLKRKFVIGWVIQSFKTESHCFVKTGEEESFRHGWYVLPCKSILHLDCILKRSKHSVFLAVYS